MMRWTLDRSEDVYHSNHREPLGKGWVRGHKIPQHLGTEVPFGQRINAKENNACSLARQAIAPVDLEPEVSLAWCHLPNHVHSTHHHHRQEDLPCMVVYMFHAEVSCMKSDLESDSELADPMVLSFDCFL